MQLRPYQVPVMEHIVNLPRCAVWLFMGAGKTLSTLLAIDALMLVGDVEKVLVLGPLRVARSVWKDEAAKWLPYLKVDFIGGDEKERLHAILTSSADIHTINYDLIPWLVAYYGDHWPYDMIVADEATKLKNFRLKQGGKRAQALAKVAHKDVKRFVELSGTPVANGYKDLYGQIYFLDAGQRLGRTYSAFMDRWFKTGFDGYEVKPLPHAIDQINDRLRDLVISIEAKDYFDLKDPIVTNLYVDLPREARRLYDQMEKKMFAEIEGHPVEAFNAAAKTMKCLQLANGAAYIDDQGNWEEVHDAKLEALEDILEESAGANVLVAYHFKSDLARLRRLFPHGRVLDADPRTVNDWNAGRIPLLFAHPASAGHGLSLQDGGHIIVFFGHNWNLEEYQQIIERIGPVRQLQSGYDRNVFIYHIVARDTVDELVMARRESKREVQDLLLDAMKRRKAA